MSCRSPPRRFAASYSSARPKPAEWLISWAMVIGRAWSASEPSFCLTLRASNSGMCLATGSSSAHLPSSHSIIIAAPVIGLVIEAMRKMLSVRQGAGDAAETSSTP